MSLRLQVVFSESLSPGLGRNNAVSPMNVAIEDFLKEHKTLNVNMNTESQVATSGQHFDGSTLDVMVIRLHSVHCTLAYTVALHTGIYSGTAHCHIQLHCTLA